MSARLIPVALASAAVIAAAGCGAGTSTPIPASQKEAAEAKAAATELCEHRVPAAICVKCHPEMAAVFKSQGDWCGEHGVPESQCFQCNPQLSFENGPGNAGPADWCKEHAVPESKCTKCHPNLVARFIKAGDFCREHGYAESVCPICHPELAKAAGQPAPAFPGAGTKVRLASAETAQDAGIRTMRLKKEAFAQKLEVSGQLDFNDNAHAEVSSHGDARVLEVLVDVGDEVKAGQGLVVVASAAAGADRASLVAAKARLEAANNAAARLEKLAGIAAQRTIDEAKRELAEAQAAHDGALAALKTSGADPAMSSGGRLVLASPLAGTVVARAAVAGRVAGAGDVLVEVADTRTLWATLEVPEADSMLVKPSQRVELRFDGIGVARDGVIAKVGPRVDPRTRTVRARVDVENKDGALKAGLFLRGVVSIADPREAVLVPQSAVQRAEGRMLVFVVKEKGVYEPVSVELGSRSGETIEVTSGLAAGDEVVTTGSFLLKTETLKDSIGAGCCDDD